MKAYKEIFEQDVELPNVVLEKMDDAFAMIQLEDKKIMSNKEKRKNMFKGQVAAATFLSILAIGSITVVAAVHHYWSRGMQGTLQATQEQQQEMIEEGMAEIFTETSDKLGVTVGNVTVTPTTVIADEKCAHISFCVEGYSVEGNMDPSFEDTLVYIGNDVNDQNGWLDMGAGFYDGIVSDENGNAVYEDGTPIQGDEEGRIISHYKDENGNMEYVINVMVADMEKSLLGKTLHISLNNIGTVEKATYTNVMSGSWEFDIKLPEITSAVKIPVNKEVEGTYMILDNIDISPISIVMNYKSQGNVVIKEDMNGIPYFCGVVLKDGTRLCYLGNGGSSGYVDEQMTWGYSLEMFNRVIEPNEVVSVLIRPENGEELIEIEITK